MIESLNVLLAMFGALVALGAANRMSRTTERTIIVSFTTTGAGLIGFALGNVWPGGWQPACDTLLLGGVVALLVGTRKATIWLPPEWMPAISYGVSAVTWVAFFAGVR